jgi:hypothetical protein
MFNLIRIKISYFSLPLIGIVNHVELLIFIRLNNKIKNYKTYRKLTMPKFAVNTQKNM